MNGKSSLLTGKTNIRSGMKRMKRFILFIPERIFVFPVSKLLFPFIGIARFAVLLDQLCQYKLAVADNRNVRMNVFADFSRIDVNVSDFRIFCKMLQVPCDPIIESRTDAD